MAEKQPSNTISTYQRRDDTPDFVKTVHQTPYPAIDPTQPSMSAAGKTILITGGATGIGFSIARNFAAAGAATVILLARRAPTLESAAESISNAFPSTQVLTYPTDITDPKTTTNTLKSAAEAATNHTIDVIVTCATYSPGPAAMLDIPAAEVRNCFETNVLANLHLIHEFLALPSTSQRIIIDTSSNAAFSAYPLTSAYGASKYGLTFLLRHIQADIPDKVRIHSFHPGFVWTPNMERFGVDKEQVAANLDHEDLPGRFAVWLASPQAAFLRGRYSFAKWDVEDLLANKSVFEKDEKFATIQLKL